jgi:hypothetical protein
MRVFGNRVMSMSGPKGDESIRGWRKLNNLHSSLYGCTALVDLGRFFQFLSLYTVGRTPWTGGSAHRKAATCTQNNTNTE